MATYTYTQLRNYIQAAIVGVLENGQAVGWNGQTYTKADLADLLDWEGKLSAKATAESFASSRKRYSGRVRY